MHAEGGILRRAPAGDAKIAVQLVSAQSPDALRDVAQQEAHVEDLVVEGKIPDRHEVQLRLMLPVTLAQQRARPGQVVARRRAFPVAFLGELELPLRADTGKPEVVKEGHERTPWVRVPVNLSRPDS